MEEIQTTQELFDVASLAGRAQAFSLIGGRCSTAELESLIQIRDKKLYQKLDPTWEAFCQNRLGASRYTVERRIRQFIALGDHYARLTSFIRIKPAEYRLIAAAVSEEGVSCHGEVIPMEPGNAPRLAQAVEALRRECAPEPPPPDRAAQAFAKAEKSLETAVAEFNRLQSMDLDEDDRLRLLILLETAGETLKNIGSRTAL
jgi:hypothetical protein